MNKSIPTLFLLIFCAQTFVFSQKYTTSTKGNINFISNQSGQTLGYAPNSGIKILTKNGFAFKDLNKNGKLDKYEDWRLPAADRAKDLATKMSIDQIAGLMLYSRHQSIPARAGGYFAGTYGGKPFPESGAKVSDLSDQQKDFLLKDNLRHVLLTTIKTPEDAAMWNNNIQALVEGVGLGIPANNSSDPRNGTVSNFEFNAGAGGTISMWPTSLGMAATFEPSLVEGFGQVAAKEYRALGIATALSPQIDIATDPRWNRTSGTFGENAQLAVAMAEAYCNGFQTSTGNQEIADGWGYSSVNAMIKHWPGGGSGEGGRDAHYGMGKYAVYPGKNFDMHLLPFTEGAFKLKGKTKMAAAVMPYYTISFNQDTKNGENVGNGYSKYIIGDLLRSKYKFDGVACTDWLITGDETSLNSFLTGKSWGVEKLTLAERHYKVLMAGMDQFGGNNEAKPIIDAYAMGVKEHGQKWMRDRMEQSAVRLLKNIFRVGLFENPYLDAETTKKVVGNPAYMAKGYEAQLKSMVLLKNQRQALPLSAGKTVYVPKQFTPASKNFLGIPIPEKLDYPVSMAIVKKYFKTTENPDSADCALVFINSPNGGLGYDIEDTKKGGNGYFPISLQYKDYTATDARETSIGGGDPMETFKNRGYKNKSVKTNNITDLSMVTETYAKMKGKPVIVTVKIDNPMVFSELEPSASAILLNFQVTDQAMLETIVGKSEPSGLLPIQMPTNMTTVETQAEDVPHDMKCHTDSEGNTYNFGFGMNWKGVIKDARTMKFKQ
jgi:beta-glucosidase